ncbi:hypothetical protein Ddc_01931 [Ditylenchus destructor]|nr:hypothetical protein Ddc_01931 [Ditylenchus destructor]
MCTGRPPFGLMFVPSYPGGVLFEYAKRRMVLRDRYCSSPHRRFTQIRCARRLGMNECESAVSTPVRGSIFEQMGKSQPPTPYQ